MMFYQKTAVITECFGFDVIVEVIVKSSAGAVAASFGTAE
jgi:hypothetical protein